MDTRLMVTLTREEAVALVRLASQDLREPREHLRYLLREAAREQGLLISNQQKEEPGESRVGILPYRSTHP